MNHEEHQTSAANDTDIIGKPEHAGADNATTPRAAPEASAEQTTPNTEPSGKYPPPEDIASFMKTLFQNSAKPHPHRALNPESAKCSSGSQPYLILKDNQKVEDLERLLPHPVRKRGSVSIDRADSFIRYVNAHQITGATAIYQGSTNAGDLQFKAIIDDHEIGDKGQANWQQHKVHFTPKLSREWRIWNEVNERDDKETTFTQLREAYGHIKYAIDHGRRVLSGEGLQMLRAALNLNYRLIDHSSEYILKQIVRVRANRASTGQFKGAQTPITDAEMFVG